MSLLPSIIRGGAAAKLDKAQAELGKAEAARRDLQDKLAALDVEQDDYSTEVQSLGAEISIAQKSIDILSLQVAGLEHKVAAEEAADKERRRLAALAKIETLLPKWVDAAQKFEAWLKAGDAALAALKAARSQIVKDWPAELERPYEFFFDLSRAIKMLRAAVTPKGVDAEAADGYAGYEREQMSALLESLKAQPKPDEEIAA